MALLERIHGGYVYGRRIRVLSGHLSELIPPDALILDVGCGDGLLAHTIRQRRPDIEITGIDVLVREETHVPVEAFDGKRIPYGDASFDLVMFVDVLHHAEDPSRLLREAVRVARQALLIKDHIKTGFLAGAALRLMDRVGNRRHGVALPYTYWTRQQWLQEFDAFGLKIGVWKSKLGLYTRPANWLFDGSLHFVARLDRKP